MMTLALLLSCFSSAAGASAPSTSPPAAAEGGVVDGGAKAFSGSGLPSLGSIPLPGSGTPVQAVQDAGVTTRPAVDAGQPVVAKPPPPPPKVPFTQETVQKVMVAHVQDVQDCYEASLANKFGKSAQAMNGRLVTTFVVDKKGLVKSAKIVHDRSTVMDKELNACVVHILEGLKFPEPGDGRDHPIKFPFKLKVTP